MKKFYAFMAAALMSASMFATAPTAADLAAAGYDLTNNVVFAIEFIDEAEVCNDVRFVGTPNNWGKGETDAEAWDNCEKFNELSNFKGWYVAELAYSEGFQGKPLQEPTDRTWTWDYQCGDKNAWVQVGDNALDITDGYADECNIAASAAGAYIYQLKYWKKHKSPCVAVVKHTYTVNVYAPDACSDMKPAIIGDFNSWATGVAMNEGLDDDFNTVYTYTFEDQEGHGFKIKEATDTDWTNEMQYWTPDDTIEDVPGYWSNFQNFELGADTVLTYDWSDNSLYRFAKCNGETAENVIVGLIAPTGAPAAGVEIIGSFDGWAGTAMTLNEGMYMAQVSATASDEFKFREAGTWDNEILVYVDTAWVGLPNLVFGDYWVDGATVSEQLAGYKVISLDMSDASAFMWKAAQGIEEVVLTEKAQKVMVDGVMYIIRDNKMYNVQGTQVR